MRERERELNKISRAFTLVEILIVVVIIWVLTSALLPRLTGYMARTRDLKRQADLRNIAAAIEMYRNEYGSIPFSEVSRVVYPAISLASKLDSYLTSIPKDPNKWNQFVLYHSSEGLFSIYPDLKNIKWEYLYRKMYKPGLPKQGAALLVAKVETPDFANYIFSDRGWNPRDGGTLRLDLNYRYKNGKKTIESINLCNSVTKKVAPWQEKPATATNKECTYSSEDQLYYIVKIE